MHADSMPREILTIIRKTGPLPSHVLWLKYFPDSTQATVAKAVHQMCRRTYPSGKPRRPQLRVAKWVRSDMDGSSTYRLRAFYGCGFAPDAPHPGLIGRKEAQRRYRESIKARKANLAEIIQRVPNSIFALAAHGS